MPLVISEPNLGEATKILRTLVASLNGIKPVANLIGVDVVVVAGWTRNGVPDEHAKTVLMLSQEHGSAVPGRSQDPQYTFGDPFSVAARR